MITSTGRRAALAASGSALAVAAIALPAYALAAPNTRSPDAGQFAKAQTKLPAPDSGARAAGDARWRVYQTISQRGRSILLTSIDAVGRRDAWAAGMSGTQDLGRVKPLIEHWNGTTWQSVRLPRADMSVLAGGEIFSSIAASSDVNAWAFTENGRYLRLSGRHWTSGRIPGAKGGDIGITSAQVFSPTDAWAFGERFIYRESGHDFVPYAARFNGTSWTPFRVPGRGLFEVSALSSRNMWALAGATYPGLDLRFRPRILHWNGAAWTLQPAQPRLPRHADLASILALSGKDVWVGGSTRNGHGGTSELAARWNGRSWTLDNPSPRPSAKEYLLGELVPDGHGGLWGVGEQLPGAARFWHWTGGRWTGPGRASWELLQLADVPRTRSIWGIALGAKKNYDDGLIILHGPVPR